MKQLVGTRQVLAGLLRSVNYEVGLYMKMDLCVNRD